MSDLPGGPLTFLYTDIAGSTRLWERFPLAMQPALARHDALLSEAITLNGGRVFQTVGDAFCAAFPTAAGALAAAVAMQQALHREAWGETGPLRVRAALHCGEAELRSGDYFGPAILRVRSLLSAGHGGQILLSRAVRESLPAPLPGGATLRDLGERWLKDLTSSPEHIFQLAHPELPDSFPPLRTLDSLPNNLPVQVASFIGREREMRAVKALLMRRADAPADLAGPEAPPHPRLLTLTGAGGCGKTRLAIQAAADLLDDYPGGVWLVELASVSDPARAPAAVAAALGVREGRDPPIIPALAQHLRSKRLLLLLDNCEHLLRACSDLAGALLRACPGLQILCTSREPLGRDEEACWPVPPLSLPDPDRLPPLEILAQSEAIRLFVERASTVQPGFALTEHNAASVAQVCHRLDGIPLALELAAARVKVLSAEQIAARLDDRFRLLTGGSRTALPRHQTLRAALDWSYALLSESERILLQRLAVFSGGWTSEAAEAVCDLRFAIDDLTPPDGEASAGAIGNQPPQIANRKSAIANWEVPHVLPILAGKSLVMREEAGGKARYRLLETVREYAQEKLAAAPESPGVRARHRQWYLALAEQAQLHGEEQAFWLARLEREHGNLRAALESSLADAPAAGTALRLCVALWPFWEMHGYSSEGAGWLAETLAQPAETDDPARRSAAFYGLGRLTWNLGDYAGAETHLTECLALAYRQNNRSAVAAALLALGRAAQSQGDALRAAALYRRVLVIYEALKDRAGTAWALHSLAWEARERGAFAEAADFARQSLALRRELGDRWDIAHSLNDLGEAARQQGRIEEARAFLLESLSLRRELGDRQGVAATLDHLAQVARARGDREAARSCLSESLPLHLELRDRSGLERALRGAAALAMEQDDAERAARLFGAAEELREALRSPVPPVGREEYARSNAALRARMETRRFALLWAEGRALTPEQAVALAVASE